ncbi:MAG: hypothetical protein K9L31_02710 [Candidatus Pacebacteria bacterium]|nr:hypothetical protein [Candidatus Paceibacterota bacterium]
MEENKIKKVIFNEVSLIIASCGVVLSGFLFLSDPGVQNNTAIKLQQQRIETQEEIIEKLTKTQQNDTQELKSEITGLRTEMQVLTNTITKLQTIIEERIPK